MPGRCHGREEGTQFVSVAVRIKPASDDRNVIAWATPREDGDIHTKGRALYCDSGYGALEEYNFSRVFGPEDDNISLFRDLEGTALIDSVFAGINETLFTYGQTGSGKTHTVFGSSEEPGLLQYFVREVFEKAEQSPGSTVHVCCYEVLGDVLTDLINTAPFVAQGELRPQDVVTDELFLKTQKYRYQIVHVSCSSTCLELLRTACENRATGTSSCNKSSSRSHAIVHLFVQNPMSNLANCIDADGDASCEGDSVSVGALTLVDLAGAEKEFDNPSEQGRRSTRLLNISLSSLNRLLRKLQTNSLNESERRQSVLCKCLWEYLRPGCGIALIFCVSATERHRESTLSTLAMAADSKLIHSRRKASVFPSVTEQDLHTQQTSASSTGSRASSPGSSAPVTPRRSRQAAARTRCRLTSDEAASSAVLTPAADDGDGSWTAIAISELSYPLATRGSNASSSGCLSAAGSASTVDSERFYRPYRSTANFSKRRGSKEELTELFAENALLRRECESLRAMYTRQQRQYIEFWRGSCTRMSVPPERAPWKRSESEVPSHLPNKATIARDEPAEVPPDRSGGELRNSSRLVAMPSPNTAEAAGLDCLQTVQAERDYWQMRAVELKHERDDALLLVSSNACTTTTGSCELRKLSHAVSSGSDSSFRSLAPLGHSDSQQTLPPASPCWEGGEKREAAQ